MVKLGTGNFTGMKHVLSLFPKANELIEQGDATDATGLVT